MFLFVSHLTVPAADHERLERHFRERSRIVDQFPGFLWLQLVKPEAGDATHTFLTCWESREAFRRYMRSDAHATSHAREPADIMARSAVRHEAFEVLMDSRHDPEWLAGGMVASASAAIGRSREGFVVDAAVGGSREGFVGDADVGGSRAGVVVNAAVGGPREAAS